MRLQTREGYLSCPSAYEERSVQFLKAVSQDRNPFKSGVGKTLVARRAAIQGQCFRCADNGTLQLQNQHISYHIII
jgi:hypothetical protein